MTTTSTPSQRPASAQLESRGVIVHDLELEASFANERYEAAREAVPELAISAAGYASTATERLRTLADVSRMPSSYRPSEAGVPVLLHAASASLQVLGEAVAALTAAISMLAKLDLSQAALDLVGLDIEDDGSPNGEEGNDPKGGGTPPKQGSGGSSSPFASGSPGAETTTKPATPRHPEIGPAVDLPSPPTTPVRAPGDVDSPSPRHRRPSVPVCDVIQDQLLSTELSPDSGPPVNLLN